MSRLNAKNDLTKLLRVVLEGAKGHIDDFRKANHKDLTVTYTSLNTAEGVLLIEKLGEPEDPRIRFYINPSLVREPTQILEIDKSHCEQIARALTGSPVDKKNPTAKQEFVDQLAERFIDAAIAKGSSDARPILSPNQMQSGIIEGLNRAPIPKDFIDTCISRYLEGVGRQKDQHGTFRHQSGVPRYETTLRTGTKDEQGELYNDESAYSIDIFSPNSHDTYDCVQLQFNAKCEVEGVREAELKDPVDLFEQRRDCHRNSIARVTEKVYKVLPGLLTALGNLPPR